MATRSEELRVMLSLAIESEITRVINLIALKRIMLATPKWTN